MRRLAWMASLALALASAGCVVGRDSGTLDEPDEVAFEDGPEADPSQPPPPGFDMLEPDPDPLPPDPDAEPDPESDPFPDPGPTAVDASVEVTPCTDLCLIDGVEYECCTEE